MTNPFCGSNILPETYAAFYRFIEGEMSHANLSSAHLNGAPLLCLEQTVTLDDETLGVLDWPTPQEQRTLDKTGVQCVIGQARIAAFLCQGNPLFAVDTLFVDDKGGELLAQDAERGRFVLHRLLSADAELSHDQLDEGGPYIWQIRVELTIPSTEDRIDAFNEDEMSFTQLVDTTLLEASP